MNRIPTTYVGTPTRFLSLGCVLLATIISITAPLPSVDAAITAQGYVDPIDPATWNESTTGAIGGNSTAGTVTVNGGDDLKSYESCIGGEYANESGMVTVDGMGSSWKSHDIILGESNRYGGGSAGVLNIFNSSDVSAVDVEVRNSASKIHFGTNGGTLTTHTLSVSPSQLTGVGTINTEGLVSDYDLVFDTNQTCSLPFGVGGTVSVHTTSSNGNSDLGAGWMTTGTLDIKNGCDISSCDGYLGYNAGSSGTATVGNNSKWLLSGHCYVGRYGNGTLNILSGGTVSCLFGLVGISSGGAGTATVDGPGSTWILTGLDLGQFGGSSTINVTNGGSVNSGSLRIGSYSSGGTMNVATGGAVSVTDATYVVQGSINFGSGGGTLTTKSLYASPTQLKGFGTINTKGFVCDGDLIFNASSSVSVPFGVGCAMTINMDASSGTGDLGAGHVATGTLVIKNGARVHSSNAILGSVMGSSGTATISGAGSQWTNDTLYVGYEGDGILNIVNGGTVTTSGNGFISYDGLSASPVEAVRMDGAGSMWSSGGAIYVGGTFQGRRASAMASITGGATVTAGSYTYSGKTTSVTVHEESLLAIDVGRDSHLLLLGGSGTLTNDGTVRIFAGAGVPADSTKYSPISAATWNGPGTYQAVGGTWSTTDHTFTTSAVMAGTSSTPIQNLDFAAIQRVLVTDRKSDCVTWAIGASFCAATATTDVTFTATAIDALDVLGDSAKTVLSGWTFSMSGNTMSSTNPIYFSLKVGPDYETDDFDLWCYNGTGWTAYSPTDLTYDGAYASFTATEFSGFAVTEAVPEPTTLTLLVAGLVATLVRTRRKGARRRCSSHYLI